MGNPDFQLYWVVGLRASTARSAHKLMARIERTLDAGHLTAFFRWDDRTPGVRETAFLTPLDLPQRTPAIALYTSLTLAWKLGQPWLVGEPRVWPDGTFTIGIGAAECTRYHLAGLEGAVLDLTNEEVQDVEAGDAQLPPDYPAPPVRAHPPGG